MAAHHYVATFTALADMPGKAHLETIDEDHSFHSGNDRHQGDVDSEKQKPVYRPRGLLPSFPKWGSNVKQLGPMSVRGINRVGTAVQGAVPHAQRAALAAATDISESTKWSGWKTLFVGMLIVAVLAVSLEYLGRGLAGPAKGGGLPYHVVGIGVAALGSAVVGWVMWDKYGGGPNSGPNGGPGNEPNGKSPDSEPMVGLGSNHGSHQSGDEGVPRVRRIIGLNDLTHGHEEEWV
jgi:hypothetical protein